MKGRDLIAVLEYGRTFDKKPTKTRRKRKDTVMKNLEDLPPDVIIMQLEKYERKAKVYREWLADKKTVLTVEEKKKEKKGWEKLSILQRITILTVAVPPAMMIYSLAVILFVKTAARAMGM